MLAKAVLEEPVLGKRRTDNISARRVRVKDFLPGLNLLAILQVFLLLITSG
jgi:hypothetical protein